MNAPVDALAVMDGAIADATNKWGSSGYIPESIRNARTAVAELIDAAEECESLLSELEDGGAMNPELQTIRNALARCGGQRFQHFNEAEE